MGFNIHILSGRRPSQNLDVRAAVAASFNPVPDSMQKQDALSQGTRPFRQHQHAGPSARADVALSAAGARGKAGASSTCRGRGNAIRFRASAPREAHYVQSAEAAAGLQVEWTAARGRAKLTSLAAVRACGHPAPQRPAISASSTRMSAAGGRTIGLRIRISRPDTAGAQDAALQERLLRAEIPLSPRRHVQHFQRPTPSHVSSITPCAPRRGDEHMARGRCGRMKIGTPYVRSRFA
jgi:hypothetical protein